MAGLLVATIAAARTLHWSPPRQIDAQPGGTAIDAISCASITLCVAVDDTGRIITGAPGSSAATWTRTVVPGLTGSEGISCPSSALCVVAADQAIAVSTDPTGQAASWTVEPIPGAGRIFAVSCPTTSFCAAVDQKGDVITSTDPSGGAGTWTRTPVHGGTDLVGVSCPTATFCAAVAGTAVLTSSDPAGPSPTWTATNQGGISFAAISCPTVNLCVATDSEGDALSSTQPMNPAVPWTSALADSDASTGTLSISCTVSGFCAFSDGSGNVVTSSNPTGPRSAWTTTHIRDFDPINSMACLPGPRCVAVDGAGELYDASRPAAATRSAWTATSLDGPAITAIACTSSSFCIAGDVDGNALSSKQPAQGSTPWPALTVGHRNGLDTALIGLACPSPKLCVGAFEDSLGGGFALSSRSPSGPRSAWKQIKAGQVGFVGIGCSSTTLCAAVNSSKHLYTSSDPGKPNAWHRASTARQRLGVVCPPRGRCLDIHGSCPTRSLCVDVDSGRHGEIAFSTDPAGGARTWKTAVIDEGQKVTGVSCTSAHRCVAVDSGGNVLSATHPAGSSWTSSHLDAYPLTAVGCGADGFCMLGDANGDAITGGSS